MLVKRYKGTNKDTTSIGYGFSYVIGASTFSGNNAPKEVNLDYGLRGIEKDAFEGCDNIETLNIVGKTEDEVKSMENDPWGIEDVSVIKCEP